GCRRATRSRNGLVKIWGKGSKQEFFTLSAHNSSAQSVAFGPDGKLIVTGGGDSKARLWNSSAGHSAPVVDVEFSPDGARLATLSSDGRGIVWDAVSQQPLLEISNVATVKRLAFSPDGVGLAMAGADGVSLFNANFAQRLLDLPDSAALSVAYSPQLASRRLAAGDARGVLKLWEVWSRQRAEPHIFVDSQAGTDVKASNVQRAHEKPINDVTFS